jgi:hypothetical protein
LRNPWKFSQLTAPGFHQWSITADWVHCHAFFDTLMISNSPVRRASLHARAALGLLLLAPVVLSAHEGMWLPTLLKAVEGDMRTEGLQISAEDIYSVNQSSLKDAVVLFGGGCTAEVVSTQGLILTNHHCGHSAIQANSTLEHNYLRDGFMAASLAEELPNPGLTATFIVRMEDVSSRMNALLAPSMGEEEREAVAKREGNRIAQEAVAGSADDAVVRPFNYGNSWFLIVSRTYTDIRMVAAPPAGIGEFGGDADNWVWPRHTGDFSVFRIYSAPDGSPAAYSASNVPFKPKHSIPVDITGAQVGEFAMVYGFPGSTEYYVPSFAVEQVMNESDPLRIELRTASLDVIDAAMNSSAALKLQYSSKQRRIANGWKKWQGEVRGLKDLDAVGKKQTEEAEFLRRAEGKPEYAGILTRLSGLYAELAPYDKARYLYSEFMYMGADLPRFAAGATRLVENYGHMQEAEIKAESKRLRSAARSFFRANDMDVDRDIFAAQLPIILREQVPALATPALVTLKEKHGADEGRYADALYANSVFADSVKLFALLDHFNRKAAKRLANDPAYILAKSMNGTYAENVHPRYVEITDSLNAAMRTWSHGLITLFPEKTWWPDANLTLRLSYGKVEGAEPRDGLLYLPFTTLEGVMQKNDPGDPEYTVPEKLVQLYNAKDYGRYADKDGELHTCFLASLHTTGGNSGSPVFNGKGELIGLNFDRMWESTMSDLLFDPALCRNISVDIRYVLFVIDKYLGGKRLLDEMQLVGQADTPHFTELPAQQ